MSILSFSNLKYSYNDKQGVLKGISGQLELGKIYAILGFNRITVYEATITAKLTTTKPIPYNNLVLA